MKYIFSFLLLIFVLVLLSGCEDEMIVRNGNGNLVIEYNDSPQALMGEDYYIKIYDNKEVEYGLNDEVNTKTLTEEEYNEIIQLAFSKKIQSLAGKDLTDSRVLDGYWTYISIYNEDGTHIRLGGSNPNQKYFNQLEHLIKQTVKE